MQGLFPREHTGTQPSAAVVSSINRFAWRSWLWTMHSLWLKRRRKRFSTEKRRVTVLSRWINFLPLYLSVCNFPNSLAPLPFQFLLEETSLKLSSPEDRERRSLAIIQLQRKWIITTSTDSTSHFSGMRASKQIKHSWSSLKQKKCWMVLKTMSDEIILLNIIQRRSTWWLNECSNWIQQLWLMLNQYEPIWSGTCFSKVPKLFGRISDDIILFVSSKRRRLEARNFAVIFIFIPFTTCEKISFTE